MDLLKRSHAPITPEAWMQIDAEAKRVLQINLAGRRLVDLDGPHGLALHDGWLYVAELGRVDRLRDAGYVVERVHPHGVAAYRLAAFPDRLYGREATARTYAHLAEQAGHLLDAGWPVIVDATFLQSQQVMSPRCHYRPHPSLAIVARVSGHGPQMTHGNDRLLRAK